MATVTVCLQCSLRALLAREFVPSFEGSFEAHEARAHRYPRTSSYASGRSIAVSPIDPQPYKTRFHELAHVLLGHTAESEQDGGELTPRNLRECEAETVAMLCCGALDLSGVEMSGRYIWHWWGPGKIPKRSAQRILKAVDQILEAGTSTPAGGDDRS